MAEHLSQKLGIDWLKTIAGALAAVSSAVLLSTLGAAGTIIGAALGSVVVTVGGALYNQGLGRSRERLVQAQAAALRKAGIAQAEVRRARRHQGDDQTADAHLTHAEERLDEAKGDLEAVTVERAGPGWRERFGMLPWKRISLVAAGLFAAAVLTITAFELVTGETLSSITGGSDGGGGTTITHLGGSDGETSQHDDKAPSDDGSSPTSEPTSEPSSEPSSELSGGPSGEASPTDEPTSAPTESPSGFSTTEPTPTTPSSPASTLPTGPTAAPPAG